jgi:hypothetical protein
MSFTVDLRFTDWSAIMNRMLLTVAGAVVLTWSATAAAQDHVIRKPLTQLNVYQQLSTASAGSRLRLAAYHQDPEDPLAGLDPFGKEPPAAEPTANDPTQHPAADTQPASQSLQGGGMQPMPAPVVNGHLEPGVGPLPYAPMVSAPAWDGAARGLAAEGAGGCDEACLPTFSPGLFGRCGLPGDCAHGEPWSLSEFLLGCDPCATVGGWFALGYTSQSTGLFNVNPDKINITQAWLYAERVADGSEGLDWGFRADILYGVDAFATQAFGNPAGTWDYLNGWDRGIYGWALPQLYGELAYGDWSVKLGHFYTIIGYEVVPAPDNFFYSHALTMFNGEPFTHTGALATGEVSDKLTVYAGWTLGWDTAFDQFSQGSNWLGGVSYAISEDATFTYTSTAGNFGWRGDDAYMQTLLLDLNLTGKLNYVFQSDLLRSSYDDLPGKEDAIGINQYLFYTLNDCWALGTRIEWWKGDTLFGFRHTEDVALPPQGSLSYYEWTAGINYKPTANFRLRPELRYDWSPAANYTEWVFGMDAIWTF